VGFWADKDKRLWWFEPRLTLWRSARQLLRAVTRNAYLRGVALRLPLWFVLCCAVTEYVISSQPFPVSVDRFILYGVPLAVLLLPLVFRLAVVLLVPPYVQILSHGITYRWADFDSVIRYEQLRDWHLRRIGLSSHHRLLRLCFTDRRGKRGRRTFILAAHVNARRVHELLLAGGQAANVKTGAAVPAS
jgi:hypothetical protein